VAFLGLVPNIAGLAILLAADGRNSPNMSTDDDDKYGQCLLFEAPEDFQRLWHILEAEILTISLSKATLQVRPRWNARPSKSLTKCSVYARASLYS
jgi:hypothetical protein